MLFAICYLNLQCLVFLSNLRYNQDIETVIFCQFMRFRQSLFWDVDPKKIDPKKHAKYIIERILDFGNGDEVRWMSRNYSSRLIKVWISICRNPLEGVKYRNINFKF